MATTLGVHNVEIMYSPGIHYLIILLVITVDIKYTILYLCISHNRPWQGRINLVPFTGTTVPLVPSLLSIKLPFKSDTNEI